VVNLRFFCRIRETKPGNRGLTLRSALNECGRSTKKYR